MITTDLSTQLCVYQLEMEFSGTYWFNTRHIYIVSIKMRSRNEWVNRGQDAHYLIYILYVCSFIHCTNIKIIYVQCLQLKHIFI